MKRNVRAMPRPISVPLDPEEAKKMNFFHLRQDMAALRLLLVRALKEGFETDLCMRVAIKNACEGILRRLESEPPTI